jgi:hypothetical protein
MQPREVGEVYVAVDVDVEGRASRNLSRGRQPADNPFVAS